MDWLSMFVPRIGRRKEPIESLHEPHPDDLDRLEELRELGSRLKLPHPVRAHVVFETRAGATQAAELLEKDGYGCQLRGRTDGRWQMTAIMQMVPTPGAITKVREQMEAAAAGLGGSYQGWEAPIVS